MIRVPSIVAVAFATGLASQSQVFIVDAALGTRLCWQGVTFDASAGLEVTNPAAITVW